MEQQVLGLAPHSPQPTVGHGLAWELRLGSRACGARNAGLEGGNQPEREGRPPPEVSVSHRRAGAIGTRGTSSSGLAFATVVGVLAFPSGLPKGHLTAPGVPGLRSVFDLATSLSLTADRKWRVSPLRKSPCSETSSCRQGQDLC